MFGLGIWELLIVVVVGLLVLGPRKLPEAARQIGRVMREFRRASSELRRDLNDALEPTAVDPHNDSASRGPELTDLRAKSTEIAGTVPQRDDTSSAEPVAGSNDDTSSAEPGAGSNDDTKQK